MKIGDIISFWPDQYIIDLNQMRFGIEPPYVGKIIRWDEKWKGQFEETTFSVVLVQVDHFKTKEIYGQTREQMIDYCVAEAIAEFLLSPARHERTAMHQIICVCDECARIIKHAVWQKWVTSPFVMEKDRKHFNVRFKAIEAVR